MCVCVCIKSEDLVICDSTTLLSKIYNNISLVKDFCQLLRTCLHCRDSAGWMLRCVGEAVVWRHSQHELTLAHPLQSPHWGGSDLRVLPFSFCFGPVLPFFFFFFLLLSPLLNSSHSCRYLVTQTLWLSASLVNVPFKVKAVSFLFTINISYCLT